MEHEDAIARCGICDVENGVGPRLRVGEGLECGHCHGLTVVVVGGLRAVTRRLEPGSWPPELIWDGYVEAADVALRDERRAAARRMAPPALPS